MSKEALPEQLGRYEIIRELGKGAMGVVYEGRDPSLGRTVAIKTARRDVLESSGLAKEMMERFLREARAAGMLNHPNIITIYDVGEEAGMAYIAMEYLVGKDLDDEIEEKKHFEPEEAVNYGVQICEALACAHDQGVFHRDVKPANIFIPDKGALKVVDFGIARTHDSTLTQDGALIGTPTYMSPEQFMGRKVDGRSDLFSAGIIMYEMLTGEKPFTGEALTTIMHHILKSDPAPPSELNFTVPDALSTVVMRALSKKPQDRYPDGRSMAAALRESLKDNPDMNIINGKSRAAEATVVSSAPIPQDGTVMDATAPGTAPAPAQDATVVGSAPVPGQDATVAGNAPAPAQDATVVGGTPPPQQAPPQQAPPPQSAAPAPTPAAAPPKPSIVQMVTQHGRLVIGVGAVLCIIFGGIMYALSPKSTTPEDGKEPPAATTEQPAENTTVADLSVRVSVYKSNDTEALMTYNNETQKTDGDVLKVLEVDLSDKVKPLLDDNWFVQTSNANDAKEIYDRQPLDEGGTVVSAPENAARVKFEIFNGNTPVDSISKDSPKWQEAQGFLIRDKAQ